MKAYFRGAVNGFVTGADVSHEGGLGIVGCETFCETIDQDDFTKNRVYDPETMTYLK